MSHPFWHSETKANKPYRGDEKIIHRIHRNLMVLLVLVVVVGGIVLAGLYRAHIIGPIRGGSFTGYVLKWSVSDHTNTDAPLQNQLTGTTDDGSVNYTDEQEVTTLQRGNDGSLQALPRIQGTLEYHIP